MTLSEFNKLSQKQAFDCLFTCCGSTNWAEKMALKTPFNSIEELKKCADNLWAETSENDWLEAFTHHPKIGDIGSLEKKFAATAFWASSEQASVNQANRKVLEKLAAGNETYWQKFGFIFIVCATGKSAGEMLDLLNERLPNERVLELRIAAGEQNKITQIRIEKLFA
jgi:2-oxo-4-hydroxy-4-carboxy-5-ureidoimidazoline decarboxylase